MDATISEFNNFWHMSLGIWETKKSQIWTFCDLRFKS